MNKYINPQLLLIDEMGHNCLDLHVVKEVHLLFKAINEGYKQNKSLIFTTNIEKPDWTTFLGNPISISAIMDRIFHHSAVVRIKGLSYHRRQGERLQKEYAEKNSEDTKTD